MSGRAETTPSPSSVSFSDPTHPYAVGLPSACIPHSGGDPMAKANSILETIGNTTELRINKLFDPRVEVWVKLERQNPGGSIKDRIALSMIEDAEKRGILRPDSIIVEPTSGNTGVGLALVAAVKGYRLILVMPESFSVERRKLMAAYGATFELTPRELGMKGGIAKAREIVAETPG